MIPVNNDDLQIDFQFKEPPTNTYALHIEKNSISGFTDGLQAMAQAVHLILSTERYEHLIYSWNYGVELADLFGQPIAFCVPEIKRRVMEALMQDSRIMGVDDWEFEHKRRQVFVSFVVRTVHGDIATERVVEI